MDKDGTGEELLSRRRELENKSVYAILRKISHECFLANLSKFVLFFFFSRKSGQLKQLIEDTRIIRVRIMRVSSINCLSYYSLVAALQNPIFSPKSTKSDSQRDSSVTMSRREVSFFDVPARVLFPAASMPAIRRSKYPQSTFLQFKHDPTDNICRATE